MMDNKNQNPDRVGNIRPDTNADRAASAPKRTTVRHVAAQNGQRQPQNIPPRIPTAPTQAQLRRPLQQPPQRRHCQASQTQKTHSVSNAQCPPQAHHTPADSKDNSYIPSPPVDYYPLAGRNSYIASKREENMIPYLILCAAVLISIIFSLSCYSGYIFATATGGFENETATEDSSVDKIDIMASIAEPDHGTLAPPDTSTADTTPPDTAPPVTNPSGGYDYGKPVPASDTASDSYIKNSVFIGDSRTEGLWLYSKMKATFICERGLNVTTTRTTALDKYDGKTALDVLKSTDCDNIYISFGVNEVGWVTSSFISSYGKLIDEIRKIKPDADIYVQNIFPMSKASHDAAIYGNNDDIWRHNEAIAEMCEEKEVYLLDVANYFTDADGNLKASYETGVDGAHFKAGGQGYVDWTNYIKTHIVK